jgi:hypothetical protein
VVKGFIEAHPIYHSWQFVTDVVLQWKQSKGIPSEIARHERCEHCSTRRVTKIDVHRWERIGKPSYRYVKGDEILRETKAAYLERTIRAITDVKELR